MKDYDFKNGLASGLVIGFVSTIMAIAFIWDPNLSILQRLKAIADLLKNQEKLAQWFAVAAAFLAVAVSYIAIIWVKRTFKLTRDMVNDTREIGKAQTRAYLYAHEASFYWGGKSHNRPRVTLSISASGLTPARWFKVESSSFVIEVGEGELLIPWEKLSESNGIGKWSGLSSDQGARRVTINLADQRDDIRKCIVNPLAGAIHEFYIFGKITYCTFFDEIFETQFCFGRSDGLPAYELEKSATTEFNGIPITNSTERAIPLPRPSTEIKSFLLKQESNSGMAPQ